MRLLMYQIHREQDQELVPMFKIQMCLLFKHLVLFQRLLKHLFLSGLFLGQNMVGQFQGISQVILILSMRKDN